MTASPPSTSSAGRLGLLAFAQFVIAVDYNIVYVALPDIGTALGFSEQSLQWVVSAYALGFGGLLMLGGRAVDLLGPRRVFQVALGVYAVSSLVGGLATSPELLVIARGAQGVGGALLFPATLTLINTTFAEGPDRTRALGVWGSAGGAGLSAGALLGGFLTSAWGWEWVLLINVPLALGAFVASTRLLPRDERPARFHGFDLPGGLVITAASTLAVAGLIRAPEVGWLSGWTAATLGAALVLLAVFVAIERSTAEPLAPRSVLGHAPLLVAMLVILIYQAALGGTYYLLTTFLQVVRDLSPLVTGLAFLPLTLVSIVGLGTVGPKLVNRYGVRSALAIGMVGTGGGLALLTVGMTMTGSIALLVPGVLVFGLFGGVAFVTMFVAASLGVEAERAGVASAMASTAQQVGGALGLAVLVAVLTAPLDGAGAGATAETVAGLHLAGYVAAAAALVGGVVAWRLPSREMVPTRVG